MRHIHQALTTMALAFALAACSDRPISQQVQAGSTITMTIGFATEARANGTNLTAPSVGYSSTALDGTVLVTDRQRGRVEYVLCLQGAPSRCDPNPNLTPRQGYSLSTTYVTRFEPDRLSVSGQLGSSVDVAVVTIPTQPPHRPPAEPAPAGATGITYRLEPQLVRPDNSRVLLVGPNRLNTLTVVPGDAPPTELSDLMLDRTRGTLVEAVPPPAVLLALSNPEPNPAAAELTLSYPASVTILDVAETASGGNGSIVRKRIDTQNRTVRIGVVDPDKRFEGLEVSFALNASAAPVSHTAFSISNPLLYDDNGQLIASSVQSFVPRSIR